VSEGGAEEGREHRWGFARDALTFQAKLLLDGLRDALMIPVSLIAAAIDLVARPDAPGRLFYRVVLWGRRSEDWIDLFEAADRVEPRRHPLHANHPATIDEIFDRLEDLVVDQHARGGVTTQAKESIDRVLDSLGASRRR
jgi:hypothetical protein